MSITGIVIWGHYKGVRGYWEWHRGHVRFVSAEQAERKASGLQIIKDIEPFQNIAIDGKVIGSRRQKRDMMKAYRLEEVGNEQPKASPMERLLAENARQPNREIVELLKKNSQGKWL